MHHSNGSITLTDYSLKFSVPTIPLSSSSSVRACINEARTLFRRNNYEYIDDP